MNDVPVKTYFFPPEGGKKPLFLIVGTVKKHFLQFFQE